MEATQTGAAEPASEPLAAATAVAKILIVDDHPANLLALEAILAPVPGLQLIRAMSGPEALKRLLEHDVALILMDVQMPGLDGPQTAKIVKERTRTRDVPIIFLTAINRDAQHVAKGYTAGAVDYLVKPFDPEILRSKVQVFVDLWRKGERLKEREAQIRIRERAQLERQNELRFQAVTEAMPLAVVAARPNGEVYWCNRTWRAYTGLDLATTIAGGWEAVVHPDERAAFLAEKQRRIDRREPFAMECRVRRADGAYRWHLMQAVADVDESGRTIGWIGTMTDVDEQRRQRESLAEFKATLDATVDCVLLIDPEALSIEYANEGAVAQLGYGRERLLAMRLPDLIPSMGEGGLRSMLAGLRSSAAPALTFQTAHRLAKGEDLPVEVIMQFVGGHDGRGRLVAVARDVRERVAAEEALRAANDAKDAFIAAASHELRTPLAAAKAQAQLALRRLREEPDGPAPRALRSITAQIDRMTKLVDDLLDVSRVQIGRLSLELAEFDAAELVREVVDRMQAISDRHQVRLEVPRDGARILADRDRLDQVVTNLLSNAFRYSPDGGEVVVTLSVQPGERDRSGELRLSVTDRGIGIPLDAQPSIFEPFGRAHGSRYGGLGLGLTICQGIVEQHGGEIWVESTGVAGEGSTFHVRLLRPTLGANEPTDAARAS